MRYLAALFTFLACSLQAAPYWTWDGFYFGLNAGVIRCYDTLRLTPLGLWSTARPTSVQNHLSENGTTRLTDWNFIGGGQIGYNLQACGWLFGIEADGNYVNLENYRHTAQLPVSHVLSYAFNDRVSHHWLVTARGRVGWIIRTKFVPYFTGGYATGDVKVKSSLYGATNHFSSTASGSKTLHGWTVGAGLEYAFKPHVTIKAEYLYVHLGHFTTESTPITTFAGYLEERLYNIREDVGRIAINYKL